MIEDGLYSLYGVPIVGEWVYKLDGTDEKTWGSHGGKIIIDDQGIHYEETTKPLGFVTEEAVKNASWVKILEKDGHTRHEYLKLSGCILWTERIEETKTILENDYGQSMECSFPKGHYRSDGYYVAESIVFSALCVLGTAQPCFESAKIGRHYEYDEFKAELNKMLNAYRKFISQEDKEVGGVRDKIESLLKKYTFENSAGTKAERYILVAVRDSEFDVIDRQENYSPFTLMYRVEGDENIVIDFDSKVKKSIGIVDGENNLFSITDEIEEVSKSAVSLAISTYQSKTIEELNDRIHALEIEKSSAVEDLSRANKRLNEYVRKEEQAKAEAHRREIDAKVDEYANKMGSYSEFLIYRDKIDYSKTIEQIESELIMLFGKYNMKMSTSKYSFTPVVFSVNSGEPISSSRYGNLLDGFDE